MNEGILKLGFERGSESVNGGYEVMFTMSSASDSWRSDFRLSSGAAQQVQMTIARRGWRMRGETFQKQLPCDPQKISSLLPGVPTGCGGVGRPTQALTSASAQSLRRRALACFFSPRLPQSFFARHLANRGKGRRRAKADRRKGRVHPVPRRRRRATSGHAGETFDAGQAPCTLLTGRALQRSAAAKAVSKLQA